jgi:hypothetical protein
MWLSHRSRHGLHNMHLSESCQFDGEACGIDHVSSSAFLKLLVLRGVPGCRWRSYLRGGTPSRNAEFSGSFIANFQYIFITHNLVARGSSGAIPRNNSSSLDVSRRAAGFVQVHGLPKRSLQAVSARTQTHPTHARPTLRAALEASAPQHTASEVARVSVPRMRAGRRQIAVR